MGTGAFTTWSALAATMRDDLASGNWRTVSSYSLSGPVSQTITYRNFDEFLKLLAFVEGRAAEEALPSFNGQIITTLGGGF
ncbi:MAG: hypothetical protein V1797_17145 [Pseudomonadota bacterium]